MGAERPNSRERERKLGVDDPKNKRKTKTYLFIIIKNATYQISFLALPLQNCHRHIKHLLFLGTWHVTSTYHRGVQLACTHKMTPLPLITPDDRVELPEHFTGRDKKKSWLFRAKKSPAHDCLT
jgi:hypothetical protein